MLQFLDRVGKILANDATPSGQAAGAEEDSRLAANLLPDVYDELRRLARHRMAALSAGQTLQPTALVHEAYVRLLAKQDARWNDSRHFFLAAARAMHDILVEHARARSAQKRGGHHRRVDLDNLEIADAAPSAELLALDEALAELARRDPRAHQVVLLRFFAGCTLEQTAQTLSMSVSTVEADWRYARAWLHDRLSDAPASEGGTDESGS